MMQFKRWHNFSAAVMMLAAVSAGMHRASAAVPADEQWPAMRGPLFNGVGPKAKPPVTWSETSNVNWKVRIPGAGTSTPVVWGEKIFIQTAVEKAANPGTAPPAASRPLEFILQCIDRQSGKLLWQQVAIEAVPHEAKHADGTFAAATPVTDGQHVWAFFGSRGLYCYDMEGKRQWSEDLGRMSILMRFGEGASPALAGDKIIVPWDHEGESFLIALDKLSGKTAWKKPRDEGTSWSTPLVVEHRGQTQIVTQATNRIRSYNAADGTLLWECAGLTRNVIPSPIVSEDIVYCMSGFSGSALLAIRLGGTGNLTGSDSVVWRYTKNTPYVPSAALYDGRLYFFASNNNVLTSLEARTGRTLIDAARIAGLQGVYASPVAADGRVYLVGRNGVTVVIKAADTLEILATNTLRDNFDASPALVGKELLLRGRQNLYSIAEK